MFLYAKKKYEKLTLDKNRKIKMIEKDKLFTPKEIGEILKLSTGTIYKWSSLGQNLHFIKLGKALRVRGEDLLTFLKKRRQEPKE